MKVRKGKAVSVALYGDVSGQEPRKQIVTIRAAEGGVHILTTPKEELVYLTRDKIPTLISYLERFLREED